MSWQHQIVTRAKSRQTRRERQFWERVYIQVAGAMANHAQGQSGRVKAAAHAHKWADLAVLDWRATWETGEAKLQVTDRPKVEPKFGFGEAQPEPLTGDPEKDLEKVWGAIQTPAKSGASPAPIPDPE